MGHLHINRKACPNDSTPRNTTLNLFLADKHLAPLSLVSCFSSTSVVQPENRSNVDNQRKSKKRGKDDTKAQPKDATPTRKRAVKCTECCRASCSVKSLCNRELREYKLSMMNFGHGSMQRFKAPPEGIECVCWPVLDMPPTKCAKFGPQCVFMKFNNKQFAKLSDLLNTTNVKNFTDQSDCPIKEEARPCPEHISKLSKVSDWPTFEKWDSRETNVAAKEKMESLSTTKDSDEQPDWLSIDIKETQGKEEKTWHTKLKFTECFWHQDGVCIDDHTLVAEITKEEAMLAVSDCEQVAVHHRFLTLQSLLKQGSKNRITNWIELSPNDVECLKGALRLLQNPNDRRVSFGIPMQQSQDEHPATSQGNGGCKFYPPCFPKSLPDGSSPRDGWDTFFSKVQQRVIKALKEQCSCDMSFSEIIHGDELESTDVPG